jgi:hypothetical protein
MGNPLAGVSMGTTFHYLYSFAHNNLQINFTQATCPVTETDRWRLQRTDIPYQLPYPS